MVDVRATVVAAVVEICGIDPDVLVDEAVLEEIEVDSLDLLEVAMVVEGELDIVVEAEAFEGVTTFGEAVGVFDRLVRA